jgi:hypothetical protein
MRYQDRSERDTLLAWQVAALSRAKTLPHPRTLVNRGGVRQTVEQQRAALAVLSEQYGIPLRRKGEPVKEPQRRRPRRGR